MWLPSLALRPGLPFTAHVLGASLGLYVFICEMGILPPITWPRLPALWKTQVCPLTLAQVEEVIPVVAV